MADEILTSRDEGTLVITINRPESRNALNEAAGRGIAAAVDLLDSDDGLRTGVLWGSGGTFCAGMDLKAFLRGETPEVPGRGLAGITQARPAKPLIAAVEGFALAGGLELALACDLVVAGRSARFGLPEVQRALFAAAGGVLSLPQRIPMAIAMEMILTGDPIDATRAYEVGLVNAVVDDDQVLSTAVTLARRIATNGPLAVVTSKRLAYAGREWSDTERWARQQPHLERVFASADAREGARAFAEKRAPKWTGT